MQIKDVLERVKEKSLPKTAKELNIGRDRLQRFLKQIGCEHQRGTSVWLYKGDNPAVLEDSIYDHVHMSPTTNNSEPDKKRTSERTNEKRKEATNEVTNEPIKETTNKPTNEVTNEATNQRKKERTKVGTNVVRKRTSFDLDVNLIKQLKIKAVTEEKNLYELVERAIRDFLNK